MTTLQKKWTVKELLEWITNKFQQEGFLTPLLDAQLLLSDALKYKNRVEIYINSENTVKEADLIKLRQHVKRRITHEPVAYILNQKYWYDLDLYVDKNVLIPRPETESLLDFVLETSNQINLEPKIIYDFATGSGCLAIALAKKFVNATVIAIDICTQALEIAQKNAKRNNVQNIEFLQMDLTLGSNYEHLLKKFGQADIIVANPPYVSQSEWEELSKEVKLFEPKTALIAQENGLQIGQTIFKHIQQHNLLKNDCIFAMELAHMQPAQILKQNQISYLAIIPMNAQQQEKPINNCFILKDLEEKERYLCKILTTQMEGLKLNG